jgi:hypothetical protein
MDLMKSRWDPFEGDQPCHNAISYTEEYKHRKILTATKYFKLQVLITIKYWITINEENR